MGLAVARTLRMCAAMNAQQSSSPSSRVRLSELAFAVIPGALAVVYWLATYAH
jgi:hypothetical protein